MVTIDIRLVTFLLVNVLFFDSASSSSASETSVTDFQMFTAIVDCSLTYNTMYYHGNHILRKRSMGMIMSITL